jgi:hypothetical protein
MEERENQPAPRLCACACACACLTVCLCVWAGRQTDRRAGSVGRLGERAVGTRRRNKAEPRTTSLEAGGREREEGGRLKGSVSDLF